MDIRSKIILIAGPTASGKSKFAIQIAKKLNGEIINADSMQVYKELKILTARPKIKDYKNINHHLYGFISVNQKFSTGKWLSLTEKKIKEIKQKNKTPIVTGGTGLYFKALTDGLVKIPNIPIKVRTKIRNLQKKLGQKKFFNMLRKLDPKIINKIKETDVQRSIRAYEIKYYTNYSIYDWFKKTKSKFENRDFYKIYIDYPRIELLEKISNRTKLMLKKGAIAEVKRLKMIKIRSESNANKIIGVKEINEYLLKQSKLDEVIEKISIKTRQYAKRQSTWARGQMGDWQNFKPSYLKKFLKKI
tara:strand:- start:1539 stop:2447 length:909 start_codon:yes stop_codon:yes gene_type:complete